MEMEKEQGTTLFELLVAITLFGILIGIGAPSLKGLDSASQDAAFQLMSYFKNVRAKALSTTSAYTVIPISTTKVKAVYANTCSSSATTEDVSLSYTLPSGATLSRTNWSVCYNPRGLTDSNFSFNVNDDTNSVQIEIMLGGASRVL